MVTKNKKVSENLHILIILSSRIPLDFLPLLHIYAEMPYIVWRKQKKQEEGYYIFVIIQDFTDWMKITFMCIVQLW